MNKFYLIFILSNLLFGANGIIASFISLSSYEIVLCRTVLGSIFLTAILLITRQKIVFRGNIKSWLLLAGSGLAMSGNWMFLYEAFNQIGVSLAILYCYCGPVLVIALSPILFHERITIIKMVGLASVIIGMVLVNGADVQANGLTWGVFCGIMSCICFALLIILTKKAHDIPGLQSSACQLIVATISVGIFTLSMHTGPISVGTASIIAILILGVLNTGVGCFLYFTGIQHLPAQSVSILGYLEPLSALIFAAIFLGETLSIPQIVGAMFILGGVAGSELLKSKQ